jgi:fatty-acyl-CoA synthase
MGMGEQLPMRWVGDWIGTWALREPERPAVYDADSGERLSYAQLHARARARAGWLLGAGGLQPGEVVALLSRNRLEALELGLACALAGVVLAPISHRLPAAAIHALLARVRPQGLFVEAAQAPLLDADALPETLRWRRHLDDAVLADDDWQPRRALALSAPWLLIHTGGSTGLPKLCRVSLRQMLWNSFELMLLRGGTRSARDLLTFPLYHIGGWNTATPILHGGGYLVITRSFDPAQVLDLLGTERINHFGGVEAMFRQLQAQPGFTREALASLESVTSAGAPCQDAVMAAFLARGVPIVQAYGLTEGGPSNFINTASGRSLGALREQAGNIGTAMPYCDYRIVGRTTGQPLADGETGVLCLRSPHAFDGYLDDDARTLATVDAEGWVWTGDLAVQVAPGQVRLLGRVDNVFISGGENVSPEEVERVLCQHPAVAEAGVVGVADPQWGARAAAAVVLDAAWLAGPDGDRDGAAAQIMAWCRTRLAGYQRPRSIRILGALPLTGAGKPDRPALRELLGSDAAAVPDTVPVPTCSGASHDCQ